MSYTRFFYKTKLKEATDEKFQGDDHYKHMADDWTYVKEIMLSIENDGQLYRSQFMPIIKNIQKKIKAGKYDHKLAPKLWGYLVDNGLKMYAKENHTDEPWSKILSMKDRKILAQYMADRYYDEIAEGNYD